VVSTVGQCSFLKTDSDRDTSLPPWRVQCTGDDHMPIFLSGRKELQPLPLNGLKVEGKKFHDFKSSHGSK
jgi:hypothetical protein